jgi:hypothetical protein
LEAAWKRQPEADRRKASSLAIRIACIRRERLITEADRSSLLAHGMQEVVGSSPTSSIEKSLQMGMFWTGGRGAWKRSGAFMEALAPDEAPFHASARWIQA